MSRQLSPSSLVLVILQFGCLTYIALTGMFSQHSLGLGCQIIGVVIVVWGVLSMRIGNFNIQPEVRSTSIVSTGIYRWVRNPMYLGILFFCTPPIIAFPSWYRWETLLVLCLVLLLKIFKEEHFLLERFGKEYTTYKKRTKRLIPFIF